MGNVYFSPQQRRIVHQSKRYRLNVSALFQLPAVFHLDEIGYENQRDENPGTFLTPDVAWNTSFFPRCFVPASSHFIPVCFVFLNREKCSFLGKPSGSSLICFHPVFFGQSWELQALPQTEQEMTDGMDRPWGEARLQPIMLPFRTLDLRVLCPIPNAPAPLWAVVGWRFPVVSRDRAFPQGGFEHISLNHFLSPPDDLFPWQNSE